MDFLHPPDGFSYPVDHVPYLGIAYEGADFDEFPTLHGFNRILVLDGFFKDIQPSRIEAFVQAWLYLGLLIEVLNEALGLNDQKDAVCLKTQDFLQTRDGKELITTTHLGSYLTTWYERAKSLDSIEADRSSTRIAHFIRTARTFSRKALTAEASQAEDFPFQPQIQSSIVVLGSLLDETASIIHGKRTGDWPQSLVALQRLSSICPNDLAWLQSQFTSEVIYYRSALSWPEDGGDHSRCDRDHCVAHQIDPSHYSTLHVTQQCHCVWVAVNEDELVSVLENGGLPLLAPPSPGEESLQWRIISDATCLEKPYVAISHVWSGGLGNPRANSLPLCQMERIANHVAKLFQNEGALFWIDTLCVPHSKHGKRLAIKKMKDTYQNADRVLVLDVQLMRTPIDFQCWQRSPEDNRRVNLAKELLLRIALCGWMRRLWTFQEGAIARELEFQFADGAVNLRQLLLAIKADRSTVSNQALSRLMILRSLAYPLDRGLQLVHLLIALRWRSTSQAEDEQVCIATLLDLPAEAFFDLPGEKRMPHLLTAIESVPTSLLFSHGPRLGVPNFSWAPQSFLNSHEMLDLGEPRDSFGHCDDSGLKVKLPGWIITQPNTTMPLGTFWWIQEAPPDGQILQVVRSQQNSKNLVDWNPSDFVIDPGARTAFVVKPAIPSLLPTGTTDFFKGLCVAVSSHCEGMYFAKILCLVVVMTCDYADLLTDINIEPVNVERLDRDQIWCFV